MKPAHSPALEQALIALRAPGLWPRLREQVLPDDMLLLLRIAAGDSQARQLGGAVSGQREVVAVEAATMFIQQVMFHPGSDSYRVLGVARDATDRQVKEHHRWLVHWLHPDRSANDWEAVYADRVNRAWQDLRTPDRRAAYDSANPLPAAAAGSWQPLPLRSARPAGLPVADERLLSGQAMKRLPMVVLVLLVLGAGSLLGVQYYLVQLERTEDLAVESAALAAAAGPRQATAVEALLAHVPNPEPIAVVPETASPIERPMPEPAAAPVPIAKPVQNAKPAQIAEPMQVAQPVQIAEPVQLAKPVQVAKPVQPLSAPVPSPAVAAAPPAPPTRPLPLAPPRSVAAAPPARDQPAPAPAVAPRASVPAMSTTLAASATPAAPALIDAAQAADLILRFRSAYASGNLNQMRALLADDTREARREGKAILRTYDELFGASLGRRIEISNASWLTQGDTAILIASYEAWITPLVEAEVLHDLGDIRFDLRRQGGQLRIFRLRHASKGG